MKCLYCDRGNKPEHFICERCGDGMCSECYDEEIAHEDHYCFPEELAENDRDYILLLGAFKGGYACQRCMDEVLDRRDSDGRGV